MQRETVTCIDMNAESQEVMRKWQKQLPMIDEQEFVSIWEYTARKFSMPAYSRVPSEDMDRYLAILFDEEIEHWLFRRAVNIMTAFAHGRKEVEAYV